VIVDHRPQLDLFDLDDLLLFTGFGGFLLRLIFVLAVIENFANRRNRIGRDFYQVEPGFLRHGKRCIDFGNAFVGTVFIDELDLADADLLVDARPLLSGGLRRSDRATNGCDLLVLLLHRRSVPRPDTGRVPQRRTLKIGSFSIQVNADGKRSIVDWPRMIYFPQPRG
jgi:hypothetical protein